jgi:hypothetical protein
MHESQGACKVHCEYKAHLEHTHAFHLLFWVASTCQITHNPHPSYILTSLRTAPHSAPEQRLLVIMVQPSPLVSNTIAPPADAPSLDLEKEFGNMTIIPGGMTIQHPQTSSSRSRVFSHIPSSTRSRHHRSVVTSSSRPSGSRVLSSWSTPADRPGHPLRAQSFLKRLRGKLEEATSSRDRRNNEPSRMHLPTRNATIGNMKRTYIEGMVTPSEFARGGNEKTVVRGMIPKSEYDRNKQQSYPAHTNLTSSAPPGLRSIFTNPDDFKMASRQTRIESMSGAERKEQDEWAQSMVKKTAVCPEGFTWSRRTQGYQCRGKHHFITDDLLAEGKGGLYNLIDPDDTSYRAGPYYPNPTDPSEFIYSGPLPKAPPFAADFLDADGRGNFDSNGEKIDVILTTDDLESATDRDLQGMAKHMGLGSRLPPAMAKNMLLNMARSPSHTSSHSTPHGTLIVNGRTISLPGNPMDIAPQFQAASRMHRSVTLGASVGSSQNHHSSFSRSQSARRSHRSDFDGPFRNRSRRM